MALDSQFKGLAYAQECQAYVCITNNKKIVVTTIYGKATLSQSLCYMFYIHMYYMFHVHHPQHILNSPALWHAATIKHYFEEYN